MSSMRIVTSSNIRSLGKAAWARCGDLEIAVVFDGYNDITLKVFNSAIPPFRVSLLEHTNLCLRAPNTVMSYRPSEL